MTNRFRSLRSINSILVVAAFLTGSIAVWFWTTSTMNWQQHKNAAFVNGLTLYNAMQDGTVPPTGTVFSKLSDQDQKFANIGSFRQITGAPARARITNIPISADAQNRLSGAPLMLAILSPDLTYKIADLPNRDGQSAAETAGEVFRKLASYCSAPFVLAKMGDAPWMQIQGPSVGGCENAPADRRLVAILLAIVGVGILMTIALNMSSDFSAFAHMLRNRRSVGGPSSYEIKGPQELQEIVQAVNGYLEIEREQLASRAAVLSGVSHDLGAPATRLRLRAALIQNAELRQKLETDIDSMMGIIESVLNYTHAEMNTEAPRKLALNSLIAAIAADYQDLGRSVKLRDVEDIVVQGGRSVFVSGKGQSVVADRRDVIATVRPISLERAITNLIENALKYGRRATIALESDANWATIVIDDEGSRTSASEIEALMAPFQRGENTTTIDGHGLGLTIVATIAKLHGGTLSFVDTSSGLSARLKIQRS